MRRLAIAGLLMFVVTAGAHAYSVEGTAWPRGQISYYNDAPDQAWAVQRAVDAWNASGARVRFTPTSRAQAQLVIEPLVGSGCRRKEPSAEGKATVGYGRGATVRISRLDPTSEKCNAYASAQTLAHELGHVLGLGHESRGCAAMNPSGSFRGPIMCAGPVWSWDCGLLHRDDIRGAVALYGGVVREPAVHACEIYAAPAGPRALKLVPGGRPGSVTATFVRPAATALPAFLARPAGPPSYVVQAQRDACPRTPDLDMRYRWKSSPGATETSGVSSLGRGTYCVAVWAVDGLGRPSTAAATSWVRMV